MVSRLSTVAAEDALYTLHKINELAMYLFTALRMVRVGSERISQNIGQQTKIISGPGIHKKYRDGFQLMFQSVVLTESSVRDSERINSHFMAQEFWPLARRKRRAYLARGAVRSKQRSRRPKELARKCEVIASRSLISPFINAMIFRARWRGGR